MQKSKMGKGCCRFLALLVLFSVVFSSGVFAGSLGLDKWNLRNNPSSQKDGLAVVYGNNTFVAVGGRGTVLTSSDGKSWSEACDTTKRFSGAITYGDSTFVALGSDGTILTSSDGKSWLSKTCKTTKPLAGIAYGEGTFVAVGLGGTILTLSESDTSWIPDEGFSADFCDITYGNGTFVAVGICIGDWTVTGTILTSSSGTPGTWTSKTFDYTAFYAVAYGGGKFVVAGYDGVVYTSFDGVEWDKCEGDTITGDVLGIAYGNSTFVAVGAEGWGKRCLGTISSSPDGGASWAPRTSGVSNGLYGIAYGNNTFVAVGEKGIILQSDPVVFPVISVSPTNLNFDSVNVGASSSKTITIKNTGSANLVIGAVSINSADFKSDTCYTRTIASGKSGEIKVVFSPKSKGSKTASLLIPSNDPYNSTVTVPLKGYGLPASNQPPTISFVAGPGKTPRPLKIDFVIEASDTDSGVGSCLLDFGDGYNHEISYKKGSLKVLVQVSHTYGKAGVYTPKVIVIDNVGAIAKMSIRIKVK